MSGMDQPNDCKAVFISRMTRAVIFGAIACSILDMMEGSGVKGHYSSIVDEVARLAPI